MKKIIASLSFFAVAFAFTLAPAFAYERRGGGNDEITVEVTNNAYVKNNLDARTNTGGNRGFTIRTGDALSQSLSTTTANENDIRLNLDRHTDDVKVKVRNDGSVHNYLDATANTGNNNSPVVSSHRGHHHTTGGVINTGNATSATDSLTLLNSNVLRIR